MVESRLAELEAQVAALREALEEAHDALDAIRTGAVDALVVAAGGGQERVFTLEGSDFAYRALVEQMHEGAATLDVRGRVLYANRSLAGLFGRPLERVIGADFAEFIVPPGDERIRGRIDACLASGEGGAEEARTARADGTQVPVGLSFLAFDVYGVRTLSVTVADLTEHKALARAQARQEREEELRELSAGLEARVAERTAELGHVNRTLRMVSECNQALIRATDEREMAEEVCRIIAEIGGYRMAALGYAEPSGGVRRGPSYGVAPGALAGTLGLGGPTARCILTGEVCFGHDFWADPELLPWRAQAKAQGFRSSIALPLKDAGAVFAALDIFSAEVGAADETETRMLRELADDLAFGLLALRARVQRDHARAIAEHRAAQLRALAAELVQAEHGERQRLAKILHDHVQQLLVAAKWGVEGTLGRGQDEATRAGARHVTKLLDQAVQATRSLASELSPPGLHERGLVPALRWLAGQMETRHGLTVEVADDGERLGLPRQSRVFLFDAVRELLFNVVKHAGVDHARVRLAAHAGEVVVAVEDDGVGFDVGRIDEGNDGGSTGLGLFSIRERLGYLGGRMGVESAPGRGSRFRLVTPLESAPISAPGGVEWGDASDGGERASSAPPPADHLKTRVLLVDDHPVVRQGLARLLADEADLEVVAEAGSGREAEELAHRLWPDVIVMDINMPNMGGVEATRRITGALPGVAVIGLSMNADAATVGALREAGGVGFVAKGGAPEELIAAIRAAARARAALPAVGQEQADSSDAG